MSVAHARLSLAPCTGAVADVCYALGINYELLWPLDEFWDVLEEQYDDWEDYIERENEPSTALSALTALLSGAQQVEYSWFPGQDGQSVSLITGDYQGLHIIAL